MALAALSGATFATWAMGLSAIVVGLILLIGFLTPIAGTAATLGYIVSGISILLSADPNKHNSMLTDLNLTVMSLALVLLGPGAFSLDARLFGRREIIIPESRRPTLE